MVMMEGEVLDWESVQYYVFLNGGNRVAYKVFYCTFLRLPRKALFVSFSSTYSTIVTYNCTPHSTVVRLLQCLEEYPESALRLFIHVQCNTCNILYDTAPPTQLNRCYSVTCCLHSQAPRTPK